MAPGQIAGCMCTCGDIPRPPHGGHGVHTTSSPPDCSFIVSLVPITDCVLCKVDHADGELGACKTSTTELSQFLVKMTLLFLQ